MHKMRYVGAEDIVWEDSKDGWHHGHCAFFNELLEASYCDMGYGVFTDDEVTYEAAFYPPDMQVVIGDYPSLQDALLACEMHYRCLIEKYYYRLPTRGIF